MVTKPYSNPAQCWGCDADAVGFVPCTEGTRG